MVITNLAAGPAIVLSLFAEPDVFGVLTQHTIIFHIALATCFGSVTNGATVLCHKQNVAEDRSQKSGVRSPKTKAEFCLLTSEFFPELR
jgi:hypothetical protein